MPYTLSMLQHIHFSQTNRPLTFLGTGGPELDLDPPYQRGDLWTEEQRVELIKSILQGLPIGVIFLNSRDIMEPIRVVDGKQRILALQAFLNSELEVPREWFASEADRPKNPDVKPSSEDKDLITASDLTEGGLLHFQMHAVAVYETNFKTEEEERELYLRINFGGVAHTEEDRERALAGPTPAQREAQRGRLSELSDELVAEGADPTEHLARLESQLDLNGLRLT